MKMNNGVIVASLLTLVALRCESAFQEINSLKDLKIVYSDNSVPLHSLALLHWFANNVIMDKNDVRLSFDTNRDLGSHHCGSFEGLLPSAPQGYQYCTIGNVNQLFGNALDFYKNFPEYVLYRTILEDYGTGKNRGCIIVSVQTEANDAGRVSHVYLTQHHNNSKNNRNPGSKYDPDHTFIITTNLLQQLRLFSFTNNTRSLQELRDKFDNSINDTTFSDLTNIKDRHQRRLGLLYLIAIPRRNLVEGCRSNRCWAQDEKIIGDGQNEEIYLQVVTGDNGNAKILWKNIPREKLDYGVAVALFKNQMDHGKCLTCLEIRDIQGSYDTSVPLNDGLQVRLKEEICRGKEFQSPKPAPVTGYAQLQLFVKNGKACFRLYVTKHHDEWKFDFHFSWVALYRYPEQDPKDYITNQWQWVIYFQQGPDSGDYNTFEYCTRTTVTPGLQARFMIQNYEEKARTPVWPYLSNKKT